MSTEQRLRDAMQAIASPVEPGPDDWSALQAALATQRHRHVREAVLATVAAAAMVAGLIVVVDRDPDDSSLRVISPATPTTAAGDPSLQRTLFAQRSDGAVDELSPIDGRVIRRVLAAEPDVGGLSMPDDRSVIYRENDSTRPPMMLAYDVSTGTRTEIGRGFIPAVSPDGNWLAFGAPPRDVNDGVTRLVIRNLRTGAERHWDEPPPVRSLPTYLGPLIWAPDSRHLATVEGYEDQVNVAVFDTALPVLERHQVPQSGPLVFQNAVYRGSADSLVVVGSDQDDYADPTPDPVLSIDPVTGQVRETVIAAVHGWPLAYDPTGRHLLYRQTLLLPGGGHTEELFRLTDGVALKLADDVREADW